MSRAIPIEVVWWAAEECHRQESGALSVKHMITAWCYAVDHADAEISVDGILLLGRMVDRRNISGFRRVPVMFRQLNGTPHEHIETGLSRLVEFQDEMIADEFYREFELIHPFIDGNGRVGSILWNWHRRTLTAPSAPPDFWS